MSAHASGVFCSGVEPPPDRTLPSPYFVISAGFSATSIRSAWVIWPTFSSNVIRSSRSFTRSPVERRGVLVRQSLGLRGGDRRLRGERSGCQNSEQRGRERHVPTSSVGCVGEHGRSPCPIKGPTVGEPGAGVRGPVNVRTAILTSQ